MFNLANLLQQICNSSEVGVNLQCVQMRKHDSTWYLQHPNIENDDVKILFDYTETVPRVEFQKRTGFLDCACQFIDFDDYDDFLFAMEHINSLQPAKDTELRVVITLYPGDDVELDGIQYVSGYLENYYVSDTLNSVRFIFLDNFWGGAKLNPDLLKDEKEDKEGGKDG